VRSVPEQHRMNAAKLKSRAVLCVVGFAILNGIIVWEVRDHILQGYGDFASFYTAGKILQEGRAARLYDRGLQWEIQQGFASTVNIRSGPLPYIRPPFEALLFWPLAYLNYPAAYLVWTLTKISILLIFPFFLPKDLRLGFESSAGTYLQGLLCLGFFPVAFDLLQGQDSVLLLLVLTMMFWFLERGQSFQAGSMLGLGLFKFHLIIPMFLVFLLRGKVKVVLGFLSAAVVLLSLSVVLAGWDACLNYPKYLWQLNQAPALAGFKSYAMPNIRGLLTPLLGRGRIPLVAQGLLWALSAGGVAMVARLWQFASGNAVLNRVGFSFCIVVTIVTSYYANSYDLTLLFLVLLLGGSVLLPSTAIKSWPRTVFVACAALLLFSPLYWILALRVDQFNWCAVILLFLAASLAAVLRQDEELPSGRKTLTS